LVSVTSPTSDEVFWVDALAWIEGTPIGSAESRDYADPASVELLYQDLGRLAARIHEQSSTWNPPSEFWRPSWDIAGCIGHEGDARVRDGAISAPLWGKYSELEDLSPEQRHLFQRAATFATDTMRLFGSERDRYGLVHADLVPDNVMDTPSGLVAIDFDDCGYGWFIWDLVTAVFWHLGEPSYQAALSGYIAGYRAVRELPDSHLAVVPSMLLIRALVYLGWMHTRRGTDTARELTAHVIFTSERLARQLLESAAKPALPSSVSASLSN
jgi:Ser/Thr protein kinase RdoA (MazF antagonist)